VLDWFWDLQFHLSFLGVIGVFLAIGVLIGIGAAQRRFRRLQNVTRGLMVSYVTIMLLLTAGELYFRHVYAESGWLWTLAGQNWHTRYVERNSGGFRDREWPPEDYADKTTVLVFGDSFTEGFGIQNVEDRYSDTLGRLLGTDYAVINIGVANTHPQPVGNHPATVSVAEPRCGYLAVFSQRYQRRGAEYRRTMVADAAAASAALD